MKIRFTRDSTASAPLIYWLLVVCGLAGITMMRWDSLWEITPIWIGTIFGVALGQVLAWQRIRGWIPAVITICGLWFAPVLYYLMYDAFGTDAEVGCLAFLPAAVCGYLALASERGALVAFWYPAVLWMLVILDGPAASAFDFRGALPLAIGLTALFIGFLRTRETRRAVLWRTYGSERLAKPIAPKVLKSSPARSLSQFAFTALIGTGALVLASWIAPHLWKLEKEKHAREVAAQVAAQRDDYSASSSSTANDEQPCCWEQSLSEEKKVRVKEYLPLLRGHHEQHPISTPVPCKTCGSRTASYSSKNSGLGGGSSSKSSGISGLGIGGGSGGGGGYTSTTPSSVTPTPTYVPPVAPVTNDTPTTTPTTHAPIAATTPTPVGALPTATSTTTSSRPPVTNPVVVMRPARGVPPKDYGAPWEWTLGLCIAGLSLHLLLRAFRRTLTLRHLTSPFWAETLDQRISNHWERMLIGLRDAGIHPAREEQPQAFARRVAIEGMTTCATILERVRHGVRVDDGDLDTMDTAASNVFREARARAGIIGRLTAWMRWPLV